MLGVEDLGKGDSGKGLALVVRIGALPLHFAGNLERLTAISHHEQVLLARGESLDGRSSNSDPGRADVEQVELTCRRGDEALLRAQPLQLAALGRSVGRSRHH